VKLLVDMNLSPVWIVFLEQAGFEVIRWSQVGAADDFDATLFAWAIEHDHVILTHDQDFSTILALGRHGKPSVVLLRTSDLVPVSVGSRVVQCLRNHAEDLERGALLVLEDTRIRVRELPM
jgi:predicted nuclease of predicted toxin-antitoxin system